MKYQQKEIKMGKKRNGTKRLIKFDLFSLYYLEEEKKR